ncbi:reverse transcriptase domain-containing protein [Tanacetum coccineum]
MPLWCCYHTVLSKVKPKNFKMAVNEDSWFKAMQDEIHEFDRLKVWELVPRPPSRRRLKDVCNGREQGNSATLDGASTGIYPTKVLVMKSRWQKKRYRCKTCAVRIKVDCDIDDDIMGPSDAIHNPSQASRVSLESNFVSFCHGGTTMHNLLYHSLRSKSKRSSINRVMGPLFHLAFFHPLWKQGYLKSPTHILVILQANIRRVRRLFLEDGNPDRDRHQTSSRRSLKMEMEMEIPVPSNVKLIRGLHRHGPYICYEVIKDSHNKRTSVAPMAERHGGATPLPPRVVEQETEETTDKEQTNYQGSTAQIPPLVIPISIPEPDVPMTLPKTFPILESDIPKNSIDVNLLGECFSKASESLEIPASFLFSNFLGLEAPEELELKDLPSHLEYAFLEGDSYLKKGHCFESSAFKGIDPRFCTHKILMEDDYKPTVQSQRRVNPKIHETLRQRLLRWVLLLQDFDITHRDKKGSETLRSYRLSPSNDRGQVEVSNRGLKRILERTVGENRASWSDKLDEALWAFRTAFKTPIGCTPYKLVYGKSCHLPIELEHIKPTLRISLIYKERKKKLHDSKIKNCIFNVGDRVLLFNSRLKIFSGKLKTRWMYPTIFESSRVRCCVPGSLELPILCLKLVWGNPISFHLID